MCASAGRGSTKLQQNTDNDTCLQKVYAALKDEFSDEIVRLGGDANLGVNVDSVYIRGTQIAGAPLHDGLNFGQTIINDYGRPYGEGFNNVTGFSGHAVSGPLSFYVRAEYQHSASLAGLPLAAAQTISAMDSILSVPPITPTAG